jgi:hypothetical protein
MPTVVPLPVWRITDLNGNPVAGALIYFFEAGTSTPVTVYSDFAQTTPHAHPIVADAGGLVAAIYAPDDVYKIRVTYSVAAGGATIYEVDNYTVDLAGSGAASISFPVETKTTNYSLVAADRGKVFLVDPAGGNIVISADSATLTNGFPFWVVNIGATGTVAIQGIAAQLVNGAASYTLPAFNASAGLVSIGAGGWQVIGEAGTTVLPVIIPGGRLTLTSATPVLAADVTAATTAYYTPYLHGYIMLYDGIEWTPTAFTELSQTLADATKSPAAAAVSSIYDMFVWNDAGTLRCTRGPPWATGGGSATARGTGAGSTELERKNGIWTNKIAITNGPAANRGVYVGTISTSASGANGQLNMMFAPAAAAGGSANRLDVWNMYNRVDIAAMCRDSTDSWTYTTATWRAANASNSNRITVVCGMNEDAIDALTNATATNGTQCVVRSAVGLDSTSVISGFPAIYRVNATVFGNGPALRGSYSGLVGLGSHFLQWLEHSQAAGATTWYGDNAEPLDFQAGLAVSWKM